MTSPEGAALALLSRLGGIDAPPVPVEDLAEEIEGLDVQEAEDLRLVEDAPEIPLGTTLSGLLIPRWKRIWVNAAEAARSPGRRRFTIAHELGHWCLHCGDRHDPQARAVAPVWCRPADIGGEAPRLRTSARIEADANRFAAALLMPEKLVRDQAAAARLSIPLLAHRFGVSMPAMQVRLDSLGLLPEYMR
jgi:Zn-dependent peptidase ImmA (M78 family)